MHQLCLSLQVEMQIVLSLFVLFAVVRYKIVQELECFEEIKVLVFYFLSYLQEKISMRSSFVRVYVSIRLPKEAVDAPSLEVFKVRLDRALSNLI